jgi:hypothetical protein
MNTFMFVLPSAYNQSGVQRFVYSRIEKHEQALQTKTFFIAHELWSTLQKHGTNDGSSINQKRYCVDLYGSRFVLFSQSFLTPLLSRPTPIPRSKEQKPQRE